MVTKQPVGDGNDLFSFLDVDQPSIAEDDGESRVDSSVSSQEDGMIKVLDLN